MRLTPRKAWGYLLGRSRSLAAGLARRREPAMRGLLERQASYARLAAACRFHLPHAEVLLVLSPEGARLQRDLPWRRLLPNLAVQVVGPELIEESGRVLGAFFSSEAVDSLTPEALETAQSF